jgi:hypothetical protein
MITRSTILGRPRRGARILLVLAGVAGAALPARADMITFWNAKAIELLPKMKKQGTYNLRGLAMVHAAMFDAVNSVERKYTPLRVSLTAAKNASPEAAAAAAARGVLLALVPQERDAIDLAFRDSVIDIGDDDARTRGATVGETVAASIVAWRADDRSDQVIAYSPKAGPGRYQPTSTNPMIAPHWGRVAPWTMTQGDQYRPAPPPALDSEQFARDLAETMALGAKDSAKRTDEQTVIAKFHAPPEFPMWNAIARSVVGEKKLALAASARVFALLNLAMADAHIAVYDAKYAYDFWRPVTAIRAGSAAGTGWEPLIAVPMHPEYPCAHCTLGAAAQTVLEAELGNAVPFAIGTDGLPGTIRRYPGFAQFAEEEAHSRIFAGLHYRGSWTAGTALGRKIGEQAIATILRPQS